MFEDGSENGKFRMRAELIKEDDIDMSLIDEETVFVERIRHVQPANNITGDPLDSDDNNSVTIMIIITILILICIILMFFYYRRR